MPKAIAMSVAVGMAKVHNYTDQIKKGRPASGTPIDLKLGELCLRQQNLQRNRFTDGKAPNDTWNTVGDLDDLHFR